MKSSMGERFKQGEVLVIPSKHQGQQCQEGATMRPCLWAIGGVGVWWLLLFASPPLLGDRSLDLRHARETLNQRG